LSETLAGPPARKLAGYPAELLVYVQYTLVDCILIHFMSVSDYKLFIKFYAKQKQLGAVKTRHCQAK